MSTRFHNPFLGVPFQCYTNGRTNRNSVYLNGVKLSRRASGIRANKNDWVSHGIRFSHLCGRNVELLWNNLGLRSGLMVRCVKEPFTRSKTFVRFLAPVWEEGLLLIRCSVFCAVISGVCLLLWYGQVKAKSFVESKLLPSVCAALSDHIQRKLDFGKVRRISPLSITLESCSIGPHTNEFSCGEAPTIKLRVLPFASLRRGKIVIDAVLSNPSLLVVQKKNYTWLGIPFSEGSLHRHLSTEEGIDHRTKIRRIAREEAAVRMVRERDDAAREAAKMGYVVYDGGTSSSEFGVLKETASHPKGLETSEPIFCMDERLHWRDHHCMDAGVEYDLKHADIEKSFGVNIPGSGVKFWSRIIPGPVKHKFKRKANGRDISAAGITVKRRILERSASAAWAYFLGVSHWRFGDPTQLSGGYDVMNFERDLIRNEGDTSVCTPSSSYEDMASHNEDGRLNFGVDRNDENRKIEADEAYLIGKGTSKLENSMNNDIASSENPGNRTLPEEKSYSDNIKRLGFVNNPFISTSDRVSEVRNSSENLSSVVSVARVVKTNAFNVNEDPKGVTIVNRDVDTKDKSSRQSGLKLEYVNDISESEGGLTVQGSAFLKFHPSPSMQHSVSVRPWILESGLSSFSIRMGELWSYLIAGPFQRLKSEFGPKVEDIVAELVERVDEGETLRIEKMIPVTLDSVHFKGGTLMLLAYGDKEPREMENASGHVKFQNDYDRVHVQLSGNCKMWRSDVTSEDGGWLSTDVFVDIIEQKWHANLKVLNLFVPLFERILEIPITWSKGRASGEVHICMSSGESFPNLHGQLDVTGLAFQIFDAPSGFFDTTASLCFRAQRIFLQNASGWFGSVPLEASGDFGIEPVEGEFHLMFQVPSVEVNALMKTFKMKPLLFPLAGSVTAVFNCQGPLDAPTFVGSGLVSRKITSVASDVPASAAYEAMMKNKEGGAVAAVDRIPFSYISANFTFNTDNCVADLYGIRASLVDGGEIRGAGNAWICPEGEEDDTAMDVNFSGNLCFDKIMRRYLPASLHLMPLKLGNLNGETKVSGSLLRPRFDIKWTAPKAEGSFSDARGDIIISHDYIIVSSSSAAFDLYSKVLTSYLDEYLLDRKETDARTAMPLIVEGVELDLRMRGFEFFSLVSSHAFDSLRPVHLKATGRIKFRGKVIKPFSISNEHVLTSEKNGEDVPMKSKEGAHSLAGEVSVSGLKLNQLMLAPQLDGLLSISREGIKLDAAGRPDESLSVEVVGPLQPTAEESIIGKVLSFSLQKGHLRANVCYRPLHSASLEVRHLPLDELELASLRGTIQRAELQLNFQKRRGHGVLSVLRPKFSGVLGEALDVAARWSGDVITVEKAALEQSNSQYELQGEYVLPGTRDRNPAGKERGSLFKRAMAGHLGSVISSMGRWRMRLEVPRAEIAEMLPLARLLSRSTDPAVQYRSKDLFIQTLHSVGVYAESLQKLLEDIRGHFTPSNEVILEDLSLPGLAELKGCWHGSLDASGGGNGDTMADFDFQGEEWEWGAYKTQRVLAAGAYSNNDGLRLEKMFIQKDNATVHADGILLGPKTNLHFAVLNFPVSLVPTLVQVIESSATDAVHPLRQLLAPIKGILHMEGDLRGSLAKPECDVQVRLLDGAMGGIDLGRAEIVASLTSTSRFLFNAKFEPIIQSGHVHIQGSIPVTFVQNNNMEEEKLEKDKNEATWIPGWAKGKGKGSADEAADMKASRDRTEEGWDTQLAEGLKGLNWNVLDVGEVRVDADIKDGGMMLLTALSPYANWLNGSAEVMLQVRGTVERPVLDGSASFHRATVSSPVLRKPLTNFCGIVLVDSNRLCINSLESRVSRKGKLSLKGNLPLRTTEASLGDKIDLKCEDLEVRAKNLLSGQVDTQLQITGSIMQPNISGKIKLSHGEAYLPHDKGGGAAPINRDASSQSALPSSGYNQVVASKYVSRFLNLKPAASSAPFNQPSGKEAEAEKEMGNVSSKPKLDICLTDLKLVLGPELRIVYPLILNFTVSGELE